MSDHDASDTNVFLCESFVKSSFGKWNIVGYLPGEKIAIKQVPYDFQSQLVIFTKVFPEMAGNKPFVRLSFPGEDPVTLTPPENPEIKSKDYFHVVVDLVYTIKETGQFRLEFNWGVRTFSKSWEIILGDSPFRLHAADLYLGGIFGVGGPSTDIRDILAQSVGGLVIIDQYLLPNDLQRILQKTNPQLQIRVLTRPDERTEYLSAIADVIKVFPNLEVRFSRSFHDRFIIRDMEEVFAFGYSLKDLFKSRVSYYCRIDNINSKQEVLDFFAAEWSRALTL